MKPIRLNPKITTSFIFIFFLLFVSPYQASKAGYSDIFVSKLVSLPTPTYPPTPYGYKSPTPTTTPYGFKSPTVTPTPSPTPLVIPSPSLTPTPLIGWSRETVDYDGDVGKYVSLALDESGYPYIAYYDVTDGDLKYAYRDAAGWQTETVESEGNVGKGASLTLDDAGRPHIAYYSTTLKTLRYAYKDLSGWQTETVRELSEYGGYYRLSLDLDQENRPHISFGDNYDQMYAYRDLVGWQFETIAASSSYQHYGWNASLKVDSEGQPHLSYYQFTLYSETMYSSTLHYAYRDSSGSWNLEFVENYPSSRSSLALDNNDKPVISYMRREWDGNMFSYGVKLASTFDTKEGLEWVKTNLKYLTTAGSVSLAHGRNDLPHLAYTAGGLWYNFGRSWELPSERVDAAASDDCSLALSRGDRPHIAYYEQNSGDLKYAIRDATPTPTPFGYRTPSPTPTPCDFRVISPNGGERWVMGRLAEIGWEDCGMGGEVTVNAYRAGALIRSFRAPNTGIYIIPKVPVVPEAAGCDYRIEVKLGPGVSDRSDSDFCIDTSTGNFRVISPNGGENWRMGRPATIRWHDCGLGGKVTVNVYRAGRLVRSFRAPNTGSFTVPEIPVIPKAAGCNYRIGVWYGPRENDRGDGDFCITAGGGGSPVFPPAKPTPIPQPTAPPPTPLYLVLESGGDSG